MHRQRGGYRQVERLSDLGQRPDLEQRHCFGECDLSDGSRAGDWRLPNVVELESLVDIERINPALPAGHPFSTVEDSWYWPDIPPTQDSWYWSSSTSFVYVNYAWGVYMFDGNTIYLNKNDNHQVWPVRSGQSGGLGSLGITDASGNAIGTQAAGAPFDVKVTGHSSSGAPITGWVSLSASPSRISPTVIWLTNGVGTARVSLDSVGIGQTIIARYQGLSGASNAFDVTGSGGSQAKLSGYVTDGNGAKVAGATVSLNNATTCLQSVTSDVNGFYSFTSAPPGKAFFVQATTQSGSRSGELTVDLSNTKPVTMNLIVKDSSCNPDGLTPILLVPGIMGSSYSGYSRFPSLPEDDPPQNYEKWRNGSWGLHDPTDKPGWRNLVNGLESKGYKLEGGCTIFPVPYDWRDPIEQISSKYLAEAIKKAKSEAGTQKVNIIAHSMGGLVTRYYIDNTSDNDIDRFVMVGTPNHGSANAYYLWQGGDPRKVDSLANGWILKFYESTTNKLNDVMSDESLCTFDKSGNCWYTPSKIRTFYRDNVQSAGQLVPTYTFLADASHSISFSQMNEKNSWLNDLNNKTNDSNYFAAKGVTAKLFGGDNKETISVVTVGDPDNIYVDGKPKSAYMLSNGDGTVLSTSLDLPGLTPELRTGAHAELIGVFQDSLIPFMTDPVVGLAPKLASKTAALQVNAAQVGPTLDIMVQGRVSPLLVDPSGKMSGINLTTGLQENGIAGASVFADPVSAGISLEYVADGVYTLTVGGDNTEDSWLTVSYMDAETNVERRLHHFNHAAPVSFTINVNSAAPERITINRLPDIPANLRADAVGTASLVTRLSWSNVTTPGVTGYTVYSRRDDQPFLTPIGTTAATTFDTTDSWAVDDTVMSHLYAVTAIKADGSESFLSVMAENNDRDHDGLTDSEETTLGTDPTKADTDGDGYSDFLEEQRGSNPVDKLSVPNNFLTAVLSVTGKGTVVNNAAGIACSAGCSIPVALDTTISLQATPAEYSLFSGWSGDCSGIGACSVLMDNDKSVTATFTHDTPHAVRLDLPVISYFPSILAAYTSATSPAVIKAWGTELSGNVTFGENKTVKIEGGYDSGYTAITGKTVLQGTMRIRNGTVRVENLIVR